MHCLQQGPYLTPINISCFKPPPSLLVTPQLITDRVKVITDQH